MSGYVLLLGLSGREATNLEMTCAALACAATCAQISPVPFFNVPNALPDECLYLLCVAMKPTLFMPKDRICAEGEEAKDLFLVVRGHVDVYRNDEYRGTISRENEGFFGEEAVLGIGAGPDGDQRSDTCAVLLLRRLLFAFILLRTHCVLPAAF